MADPTDTPTDSPAPAAPRRRGPRKTAAPKAPSTRRPRQPAADKSVVASAEEAVTNVAATATRRVKRGAARAEEAVVSAVKSVTPSAVGRRKPAAKKTAAKAKAKTKGKRGWGVAAVVGGLAATGAAAAALLSLKGSVKLGITSDTPTDPADGAHQPDGTDSSKSFDAQIADENTVPN